MTGRRREVKVPGGEAVALAPPTRAHPPLPQLSGDEFCMKKVTHLKHVDHFKNSQPEAASHLIPVMTEIAQSGIES